MKVEEFGAARAASQGPKFTGPLRPRLNAPRCADCCPGVPPADSYSNVESKQETGLPDLSVQPYSMFYPRPPYTG